MSSTKSNKQSEPEPKEEKKAEKSAPCFSRRVWTGTGTVEVSVWDKIIDGDNGEYRVFNVVAKRTWKDNEGYQSGNSFRPEDLLPLALFLEEAYSFIADEQARK